MKHNQTVESLKDVVKALEMIGNLDRPATTKLIEQLDSLKLNAKEEPREALELLESLRLSNKVTHDEYIQLFDAIQGAA